MNIQHNYAEFGDFNKELGSLGKYSGRLRARSTFLSLLCLFLGLGLLVFLCSPIGTQFREQQKVIHGKLQVYGKNKKQSYYLLPGDIFNILKQDKKRYLLRVGKHKVWASIKDVKAKSVQTTLWFALFGIAIFLLVLALIIGRASVSRTAGINNAMKEMKVGLMTQTNSK